MNASPSSPIRALLKIGGEVIDDGPSLRALLGDVQALRRAGFRIVIVHGAGPQTSAHEQRLGLVPHKIAGRRVTDAATLRAVKQVLGGEVNLELVAAARAEGLPAVGISGISADLVRAHRLPPTPAAGVPAPVDYGFVGEVASVDPRLVLQLWAGDFVPIVNPLGLDVSDGVPQIYNINADTVAAALAAALACDHLFLVTAVSGVLANRDDPGSRIPSLRVSEARAAIASGIVEGGMIPKVADVLPYLERGRLGAVHILPADALRGAALEPGRFGTVLVPDHAAQGASP